MVSVDESKIFCLYCRGVIIQEEGGIVQQYHQDCFEEIIKDNHCEYCLELLNELNDLFTKQQVKIHQKCHKELEKIVTEKVTTPIQELLEELPLKKLAKDFAFYEMNNEKSDTFSPEVFELSNLQLPDFSNRTEVFQKYINTFTEEIIKKLIAKKIDQILQVKLHNELQTCRTHTKNEIIKKTLSFVWSYYLEIPISYKDNHNHKVMFKPVSDSVDYTIFHYELEKLFKTPLDYNKIINSNFNEIQDYLLSEPISLQNLQ